MKHRVSIRSSFPFSGTPRSVAAGSLLLAATAACDAHGAGHDADILYTEYGIAHVRADDYPSLGLGLGYAQAGDNLCKIEVGMLALDGQLSRAFGPDRRDSTWALTAPDNLTSDLYFSALNQRGAVERLLAEPPPLGPSQPVRELVAGFVQGFNARLAEQPVAECSGAEWLRPMTELDVYRRAYAVALFMGQGFAAGQIVAAEPPVASVPLTGSVERGSRERDELLRQLPASNAVALGSEVTASGGGINVANPHLIWGLELRWWQAQLSIPGELDVSGATLLGLPVVVMGHTDSAAWSITTTEQTRHLSFFQLTLAEDSPTTYLVDGQPEEMEREDVRVEVRQPDGSLRSVQRALWWTRYGAVVGGEGLEWTAGADGAGRAYAVADPNSGNLRVLDTLLAFDHARSVQDVLGALRREQGAPWWTVVAADAAGQASFAQIQVAAHVSDEQALDCTPPGWPDAFAVERSVVLDGSRSECAWQSDADAVEPGIFGPGEPGVERLPWRASRRYVANSNDSHWLASASERIEGKARILGDERTARSLRTRGTFTQLEQQIAQGPVSREDIQELVLSHRSHAAELALDDTLALCVTSQASAVDGSGQTVDLGPACTVLALWDRRMDVESRGGLLFDRYWRRVNALAGDQGVELWRIPFAADAPVQTPRQLDQAQPFVAQALADTVSELAAAGIPLDARLGDYQYVERGGERIPLGGAGGPDGQGVFDILDAPWDPAAGYTGSLQGSTYLHVVSFDGTPCPDAVTLLTYSQSDDALSAHHVDQTWLYSRKQWVTDRFCLEDVLASPELQQVHVSVP